MNSFGRYTVSYTPSDDPAEYLQVSTEMGISSEATLPDMLNFFTDFLRASGYVFDGELGLVSNEKVERETDCLRFKDTAIYGGSGTDTISLAGAGVVGGFGNDVISLG